MFNRVMITFVAFALVALSVTARDDKKDDQKGDKDAATVKVVKVQKGDDEITVKVAIEWAKDAVQPKASTITLVFLFQDNPPPTLKLDVALLANMGDGNAITALKSGNMVVVRDTADPKAKQEGHIIQVISGDGSDKAVDYRKNGEYTLILPTKRAGAFEVSTATIHVGMFQQTDPKNWQQKSTSYKSLGKVVKLPNK
jgi:hypothetical protein